MNEFKIIRELNNKNDYKQGLKNCYYWNNNKISKQEFYKHLKFMINNNNRLYYEELKKYNFDYVKQYHNGVYNLYNFKDVLNDLKSGLIYTWYISIGG